MQVATLLTIIGEGTPEVFAKFKWDGEEDQAKLVQWQTRLRHIVNHEKHAIWVT